MFDIWTVLLFSAVFAGIAVWFTWVIMTKLSDRQLDAVLDEYTAELNRQKDHYTNLLLLANPARIIVDVQEVGEDLFVESSETHETVWQALEAISETKNRTLTLRLYSEDGRHFSLTFDR